MSHRHSTLAAIALICLAAGHSRARADISRFEGQRGVAVDLTYGSLNLAPNDFTVVGLTARGAYFFGSRLAVGGILPLAHLRSSGDSFSGLGNLSATIDYILSGVPATTETSAWLSGILALPTATGDNDSAAPVAHALYSIPEPGLWAPDTTTVDLQAHYRRTFGRPFARIDAGGQYLSISGDDDRLRAVVRIGGGARVSERIVARASLFNAWELDAADGEDNFLHALEGGIGIEHSRGGRFDLSLYVPLDSVYRNDLEVIGIRAGFSIAL
jgi:hypothetical protein